MAHRFEIFRRALALPTARDPEPQLRFAVHLPDGSRPLDPPRAPTDANPRSAAVILLISDPEAPKLTLIQRSDDGGVHAGQIAFPGGSREPRDLSLEHTALRETHEELGLHPSELEVLGPLAPVFIPPSNFVVTPFVALHRDRPHYCPDELEVADVFEAPLAAFSARDAIGREVWRLRGELYQVPFYRLGDRKIWGATARMLAMLIATITDADPTEP